MIITFIPSRNEPLTVQVAGDAIILNGEEYDFSPLQEGEDILAAHTSCSWFQRTIERINGVIHVTLICPFGAPAPDWKDDGPWTINASNGFVQLKSYTGDAS